MKKFTLPPLAAAFPRRAAVQPLLIPRCAVPILRAVYFIIAILFFSRRRVFWGMFTGLVEEVGECLWLRQTSKATQLTLTAKRVSRDTHTGDSVAINGCCLTITSHRKDHLTFDVLDETLRVTNLDKLRPGSLVNLERALPADGRLGGHFVQGHVDCTSGLLTLGESGADLKLEFALPSRFARYVAHKGSVAINGVSLTVAEISESSFAVWIIPHTRKHTNLGGLMAGDTVNLEFDILAKYAERLLADRAIPSQS